jgi:dihydrofolate reductase/thymidylate synthase
MAAVFRIIVAMDERRGIAKQNKGSRGRIPWHYPDDLEFFRSTTLNQTVIMGRKTYESIGAVLPNRTNYILSNTAPQDTSARWFSDVHECIRACRGSVYIIGGAEIYSVFLSLRIVQEIIMTLIPGDYGCNVFFPGTPHIWYKSQTLKSGLMVDYLEYKNTEERAQLALGRQVMAQAAPRDAPRDVPQTLSSFGHQLKFDLTNHTFPLMTSRRLFFRGIVEELLLLLAGSTDSRVLESRGVNVWRGNTSREFLDSRGLQHMPAGDMGASYGWLARHFGAQYTTCEADYTDQGFDQIDYVIRELKTNPTSRRLIISLWDPNSPCPLPPCLYNYQFYSEPGPTRRLSCMMTQRSSDFAVAGGWNVAAGALLTVLIARVTGHTPHTLIWNIGDLHVYQNLVEQFKMQCEREPRVYPKIYVPIKDNIRDYRYEDIELIGYNPHDKIDYQMAV